MKRVGNLPEKKLMQYIVLLIFISAVAIMLYSILDKGNGNMNTNKDEIRTDKEPISSRFPNLGEFNNCYWKADIIDENNRVSVPGPSSYWMKGFIVLNSKEVNSLKNVFKWSAVKSNWKPSLYTNILNLKTFKWSYSEDFNNYIMSASYVGKFYMDLENGIVFFDVQK